MFAKIVVIYRDSPEAGRALDSAVRLSKQTGASLHAVMMLERAPAYAAFGAAVDPSVPQLLEADRALMHDSLQRQAQAIAHEHGVALSVHCLVGRETKAILDFLHAERADLLVVGLHRHDLYISRLWSSVYDMAQQAPCSVLGIH